jgi:ankyrin repeat protein
MSAQELSSRIFRAIMLNSVSDLTEALNEATGKSLDSVLNHQNVKFQTPLHLAASQLQYESIDILLLNGADPNAQDLEGSSALHAVVLGLNGKLFCIFIC